MLKLLYNCPHFTYSWVKLCSKYFKLGFSRIWTENSQLYKLGLEKTKGSEIKLPAIVGSLKKQQNSRKKHLLLLHWLHQSLWPCGSQQTVENSSRDGDTSPPYLPPEIPVCFPEVKQWNGSKLEKEYVKAVYCHLAYLTSM